MAAFRQQGIRILIDYCLIDFCREIHFLYLAGGKQGGMGSVISTGDNFLQNHISGFCFQYGNIFRLVPFGSKILSDFLHGLGQFVFIYGLCKVKACVVAYGRLGICKIGVTAQYDKFSVISFFPCRPYNIGSVYFGHADIQKDKIGFLVKDKPQGVLSVGGFPADAEAQRSPVYNIFQAFPDILFVIGNQYGIHAFLLLCFRVKEMIHIICEK